MAILESRADTEGGVIKEWDERRRLSEAIVRNGAPAGRLEPPADLGGEVWPGIFGPAMGANALLAEAVAIEGGGVDIGEASRLRCRQRMAGVSV